MWVPFLKKENVINSDNSGSAKLQSAAQELKKLAEQLLYASF